ncbi:MAG: HAD hydrolase-like protein [Myxococcota bacterium]|nr:HAD hydrolase-like protein [Myxococcota bacterium]
MLSNILFDLDGTLTDPKDGITRCIQFSLDQLGADHRTSAALTWCIGPPLRGSFSKLLSTADDGILDAALGHYRKRFTEVGMYENAAYPGVVPMLQRIQAAGFRVFLATSKPRVYAEQILNHFDLSRFFHGIYGSHLDGRLSEKEDLLDHIIKSEHLVSEQTLIVGDRSYDIVGGKKHGMLTAAVTYGYGTHDEITAAKPDFIFQSPDEVAAFVASEGVAKMNI